MPRVRSLGGLPDPFGLTGRFPCRFGLLGSLILARALHRLAVGIGDRRLLPAAPFFADVPLPAADQPEADLTAPVGRQDPQAVEPVEPVLRP